MKNNRFPLSFLAQFLRKIKEKQTFKIIVVLFLCSSVTFFINWSQHSKRSADMHEARYGHFASLMNDGTVIIMFGEKKYLNEEMSTKLVIEQYLPSHKTFKKSELFPPSHRWANAVKLPNEKIFFIGSRGVIFSPHEGLFEELTPTLIFLIKDKKFHLKFTGDPYVYDRNELYSGYKGTPTMSLLHNKKILVTGGTVNLLDSDDVLHISPTESIIGESFLFDPHDNSFTPTGRLNCARDFHQATLLKDGKVLITGGVNKGGCQANEDSPSKILSAAEIFDPLTGQFTKIKPMNLPRHGHTATLLEDGKVLITGGWVPGQTSSAEIYDPESKEFRLITNMNTSRFNHTATLLKNGNVLIVGGCDDKGFRATAETEIFISKERRFVKLDNMQEPRCEHTATLLTDGSILIAGGLSSPQCFILCSPPQIVKSTELFIPD